MKRHRLAFACGIMLCLAGAPALAQTAAAKPVRIDFVSIGGNDCPPCVVWRAVELPKLQALPEWQMIRYHYVTKSIQSPVPSAFFFPSETRHLQPALKEASNGWSGSPQQALLVDGKVVDYWYGTRKGDPHALAAMIRALHEGKPLPRDTCAELDSRTTCKKPGKAAGAS
jgi:hypothetical protein